MDNIVKEANITMEFCVLGDGDNGERKVDSVKISQIFCDVRCIFRLPSFEFHRYFRSSSPNRFSVFECQIQRLLPRIVVRFIGTIRMNSIIWLDKTMIWKNNEWNNVVTVQGWGLYVVQVLGDEGNNTLLHAYILQHLPWSTRFVRNTKSDLILGQVARANTDVF